MSDSELSSRPSTRRNHLLRRFADDVVGCVDDDALRQLAESLDTGLLRPKLSKGGQTPSITPSPRLGIEDSIEDLHEQDIESATRNDQSRYS
ncbi:hypothetical protein N7486_006418 [Penicillium sp. IBT 16267x]|nr:hypothetical protein N7486_006418 [Penicillium sp. IBT 16267x]